MTFKTLIVGQSAYNKDNVNYGPFCSEELSVAYPFQTIAFMPKKKKEKYMLYNLTSYRRVMSFLEGKSLSEEEFEGYKDVESTMLDLTKKDVYLVNLDEIKDRNIDLIDKAYIDEDTKIILFGSKAIDYFEVNYKDYKLI